MSVHVSAGSLVSLITVAMLVTSCGGSPEATASPTSTAAPTPTVAVAPSPSAPPSPTPVADVSRLFTAKLVDPQFEGAGSLAGSVTIGNLEGSISGKMQMKGRDSSFEMTMDIPNVISSTSANIKVDGSEYASQDGGPWFRVATPDTGSGLSGAIGVAALTASDEGIVTKQGQQLHHMVPGNGSTITATDLGITDPSMAAGRATLDFYARDDGSLAVMSIGLDWTVDGNGTPVPASMALDFTFDKTPTVSIAPPEVTWTMFASKQHAYSMGYPEDWTLVEAKAADEPDVFRYSSTEFATAIRERQPTALSGNLDAYVKGFKRATPWKMEIDAATTVAGKDAWRLAYHKAVNDQDLYFVFTLSIEGRDGYSIAFVGPTGYESDIVAFHEMQLTTLVIPGG